MLCTKTVLVYRRRDGFEAFAPLVMPMSYQGIPIIWDYICYAANDERFQPE